MNGFGLAVRGLDLFGFEVDGLPNFVETALLQAAVVRNVGGDLEFLPVGVGLNARIEASGASARLNVQRAREKECS